MTARERERERERERVKPGGADFFIHESSVLDLGVKIGNGVKIWHFCHILSGTQIGENTSLGQNCVIGPNVKIGNGCKIQGNVSLFSGVVCEDLVFIGPSAVFTNILTPRAFVNRKNEFLSTILRKGCSIGANATIVCGVEIGEFALVGAGAVVKENVKPHALVVGVPARQIGWVDKAGLRLVFDVNNCAEDSFDGIKYKLENTNLIEV